MDKLGLKDMTQHVGNFGHITYCLEKRFANRKESSQLNISRSCGRIETMQKHPTLSTHSAIEKVDVYISTENKYY